MLTEQILQTLLSSIMTQHGCTPPSHYSSHQMYDEGCSAITDVLSYDDWVAVAGALPAAFPYSISEAFA